jgi:hypothetical protein
LSSPNLARSARKIEELPADDGSVLDTIAGAILRIFVRINRIEAEHARLGRRLKAVEDRMPTSLAVEGAPAAAEEVRGNGAEPRFTALKNGR